jgi:serine protease Do
MRKYILTIVSVLPLLLSLSHAAQSWSVDPPAQPWGLPGEDSGTGSYLGVDISDVTTDRLGALKLKEEKGVEVTMVDQDAPAGKAGIKEHDVILSMNGTPIESGAQIKRMIRETPPGRLVTFELSRDGQPLTIKVQLADRRKQYAWTGHQKSKDSHVEIPPVPPVPNIPDFVMPEINVVMVHSSARSGLMVENLTPQLGEFFGVKNGKGVLIRSVEKGSRAEKAGFRAGDVIVKVNDQPVHDTSDFTHALRPSSGGSINVGVIRDKKEQNLNLTLPPHKESGEIFEEEGLELPIFNADSYQKLSQVQDEIARLRPQMELASEEAGKAAQEMRKTLCEQKKLALEQQATKLKRELQPQLQQKLKREQEKLKNEMERLQHEMRGEWLDI